MIEQQEGAVDVNAPPCSPPHSRRGPPSPLSAENANGLDLDFLARRAEAREAHELAPTFSMGLVEAGAVADGAGAAERRDIGLVSVPPGQALWAAPSGRWESCILLLEVSRSPLSFLVRLTSTNRGAVHYLLPEWAVKPFAAQEPNCKHPFSERPIRVAQDPTHVHRCDANASDGVSRWLPVWVPPPEHAMHRALWSGAGLADDGKPATGRKMAG